MSSYNVPRGRRRNSRKIKITGTLSLDNPVVKLLSTVAVISLGVLLAGMIALKLYLISLPPIKNLNSLKPNIVTTFCIFFLIFR